jgi:hypothetical protein
MSAWIPEHQNSRGFQHTFGRLKVARGTNTVSDYNVYVGGNRIVGGFYYCSAVVFSHGAA